MGGVGGPRQAIFQLLVGEEPKARCRSSYAG